MDKLQYKTFLWPTNPERYHVSYSREPQYIKTEEGETVFTGMGPLLRTITGSGAFTGEDAYFNFRKLAAMMNPVTPGRLTHPIWGSISAYLTDLTLSQEPKENYVAYTFTFREADSSGNIPK